MTFYGGGGVMAYTTARAVPDRYRTQFDVLDLVSESLGHRAP